MLGSIQVLDSINDVEYIATEEGSVGPLLYGDAMSCHVIRMKQGYYPPHPHAFELTIMVLDGECDLLQGDHRHRMRKHSLMMVRKNEEHGWEVMGPSDCIIYVMVAPKQWTRSDFYAKARKTSAATRTL